MGSPQATVPSGNTCMHQCGVFHGLQWGYRFGMVLSVGCKKIPALPWFLPRLQGNPCSSPWSTSVPQFFFDLGAHRAVCHTFSPHSSLFHIVVRRNTVYHISALLILRAWETSVLSFLGYNIMEAEGGQEVNLVSLFCFCRSSLWTELCLKVMEIFI